MQLYTFAGKLLNSKACKIVYLQQVFFSLSLPPSLSGACQEDVATSTSSRHDTLSQARRFSVAMQAEIERAQIVLNRSQLGLPGSLPFTFSDSLERCNLLNHAPLQINLHYYSAW